MRLGSLWFPYNVGYDWIVGEGSWIIEGPRVPGRVRSGVRPEMGGRVEKDFKDIE